MNTYRIYLISIILSLGGLILGCELGMISGTLLTYFNSSLGVKEKVYYEILQLFTLNLGGLIGASIASFFSDKYSRRSTLVVSSIITLIGLIFQLRFFPNNIVLAARSVGGLGLGAITAVVPVYLAEIAPSNLRARLHIFTCLFQSAGFGLGYLLFYWEETLDYDLHVWFPVICTLLLSICLIKLPKSPRWLMRNRQYNQAMKSLAYFRYNDNCYDPKLVTELNELSNHLEKEGEKSSKVIRSLKAHPSLGIAIFLQFYDHFTGASIIIYYFPILLNHFEINSKLLITLIQLCFGLLIFTFNLISIYLIENYSNKNTLVLSSLIMGAIMLIVTILISILQSNPELMVSFSTLLVILLSIYIGLYSISIGPMSKIYPNEIFNMEQRSYGVSICTSFSWLFNSISSLIVPMILQMYGFTLYGVYSFLSFAMSLHIYIKYQDIQNIELELIDDAFNIKSIINQPYPRNSLTVRHNTNSTISLD